MKKTLFILVIFAILLSMSSCEEDPDENPFAGTWERDDKNFEGRLIFTEKSATLYFPFEVLNWTGIYTYDDNNIIVTINKEQSLPIVYETYGDSFTLTYRFIEDGLLLFGDTLYRKITK
jgi:hypothetical protein